MRLFAFAIRSLHRDRRAGELHILALALVIAVGSVTAVGFFSDRARSAMTQQAGELLAADLLISATENNLAALRTRADKAGLRTTETVHFVSVALAGAQPQLTEVKAVQAGYPLRGSMRVAASPYGADEPTREIPAPGGAWPDAQLASALNVKVGDSLALGGTRLRITRILAYEPDRGGDLFSIAPRLLMNTADLAATGLIQPGSRIEYRLLLAGAAPAIAAFRTTATPTLPTGARIQSVRDARPELRAALDRAEQFLGLAALVAAILAGVAIAVAAQRFANRHLDHSAMMRCLGATQSFIVRLYALQMLIVALIAAGIGCLLGFVAQFGIAALLGDLVAAPLAAMSWRPLALGLVTGVTMLLGFALPPLWRLKSVPPLRVLRRDLGPLPVRTVTLYGSAALAIAALLLWHVQDVRLALLTFAGLAATLLILVGVAAIMVRLLARLRGRVGITWRFGFANLARHGRTSIMQIAAFGAGMMVLLLLGIVRTDLLSHWQRSLPADAPNHFLINIQADQRAALTEFFSTQGIAAPPLHPMVRGRLLSINGETISPQRYSDARARRLSEREFNLSWSRDLPRDNQLVGGSWWSPDTRGEAALSVEQGLAETLKLKLGDTLAFRIGASEWQARITSLRKVEWDTFQVNFFVLAPPGTLEDFPASFITSFHLAPHDKAKLAALVARFPNVTVIDVDALMRKVRDVMGRVTAAVEFIFGFSVLAGLTVLFAAMQATQDTRRHEAAVLRTLGATRAQLRAGLIAEFVSLGALAGAVAALCADAIGWVLATFVFDFGYSPNPWLWLFGIGAGALGIGAAGLYGTRTVLRVPPLRSLTE